MRILTLDQSFQAKKINLKDYAIFEEPILTNEKIISPKKFWRNINKRRSGLWRMPKMYLLKNE